MEWQINMNTDLYIAVCIVVPPIHKMNTFSFLFVFFLSGWPYLKKMSPFTVFIVPRHGPGKELKSCHTALAEVCAIMRQCPAMPQFSYYALSYVLNRPPYMTYIT